MTLIDKLHRKDIRNAIDLTLIDIPIGMKFLEGIDLINRPPNLFYYTTGLFAAIAIADIFYRYTYNKEPKKISK